MSLDENQTPDLFGNCNCLESKRRHQEVSCIETPVILDQLQMRECLTRNIALSPKSDNDRPSFKLKGADDFKIKDLRLLSKIPIKPHSDKKTVNLSIIICYNLIYSDGLTELIQPDEAYFEMWIDEIKFPDRSLKLFQKNNTGKFAPVNQKEKAYFSAEAMAQTFGEVLCSQTGALIIDLGVFFIIKSISLMQLSVPSVVDFIPYHEQKENSILKNKKKQSFY